MTDKDFTMWAELQELDFPILFDEGAIANQPLSSTFYFEAMRQQFGIQSYQSSLFIDANSNVVETHVGVIEADELREKVDLMASAK